MTIPQSMTPTVPLEDTFADILQKAQRGRQISLETLAEFSCLPQEHVQRLLDGEFESNLDTAAISALAFVLDLHPDSLLAIALNRWQPREAKPLDGFAAFTSPFGNHYSVNAYLLWDPKTRMAATFDTGSSCEPMLQFIEENGLTLSRVFITHTHADHMMDLNRLIERSQAVAYGSATEHLVGLQPLRPGDGLTLGQLRIRVLGTSGHTPGGLSYFVTGLRQPVVVVGDAIFAGSQGGATHAYQEALQNNRTQILTLPPDTRIAPGHGPLTTVGEERRHNPFFPELKEIT